MSDEFIDLSTLDVAGDNGAEIELLHPVKRTPINVFITVVGQNSKQFRNIVAETTNRDRREGFLAQKRGKPVDPKTAEQSQAEATELLATCTIGFRNVVYKGAPFPYSHDNAVKLYSDSGLSWIRNQVDEAIIDLENFIKS